MLTAESIQVWLGLPAVDEAMRDVVPAVNSFVDGLALPTVAGPDGAPVWSQTTMLGAKMLAARLHRRRNSPNGIEAMTEAGTTYTARHDSDVSRLLKLDGFAPPRIG